MLEEEEIAITSIAGTRWADAHGSHCFTRDASCGLKANIVCRSISAGFHPAT
jgi:hypothetical protein